jgi:hypothetical protein
MRLVGALLVVTACGGYRDQIEREKVSFHCGKRVASYTAIHHMSGDEAGVEIDCAAAGPRLRRWKVDKAGTRVEDSRSMTPVEFDKLWTEIDGVGWRYMSDCTNGSGNKRDPVYTFDFKDETDQKSFSCQAPRMPFPYNGIVDPLDFAAFKGRKQLGDDEPAEAKELDKKHPK